MISETHFTDRHYRRIPKYKSYSTNYSYNKAHEGIATIIRDNIKHYEWEIFNKD